jgi:hypothetical protein
MQKDSAGLSYQGSAVNRTRCRANGIALLFWRTNKHFHFVELRRRAETAANFCVEPVFEGFFVILTDTEGATKVAFISSVCAARIDRRDRHRFAFGRDNWRLRSRDLWTTTHLVVSTRWRGHQGHEGDDEG